MAEFNLEQIIKSGVEKALNKPIVDGKSITEWAAIGMKAPRWVSVKDRLPKTEQKVLVSIKTAYGTRYTTIAAHVGYHERNSESDGWSLDYEIDWEEYDEENDVYWVPECWYEVNFVDDNPNWIIDKVDGEITHWMPIPEPPKEEPQCQTPIP